MRQWIGSHPMRLFLAWSLSALVLGWLLLTLSAARGGAAALPHPAATVTAWRAISGQVAWQADGVPVCTVDWDQGIPMIVSDGTGGAIITWVDERSMISADIYAQRVYSDGTFAWAANGVPICQASGDQEWHGVMGDGAGGALVVWEDQRSGNWDIYMQRVYSDGAPAWTTDGLSLCVASGDQRAPRLVSDGAGGAIVVWEDRRSGNTDIYAQRVYSDGKVAWGADGTLAWLTCGISLTATLGDQAWPELASDGEGGAIVAWRGGCAGAVGICVQRVRPDGQVAWATGGIPLSTGPDVWPGIVNDGAGGAVVAWGTSYDGNADLYAQRVYSDGRAAWAAGGVAVSTAPGSQSWSVLVSDDAGGAIVAWQDGRDGTWDIYAQRIYSDGTLAWTTNGISIAGDARYYYWYPDITSDGAGGAIVAWQGPSGVGPHVYAQRVRTDGILVWKTGGVPLCVEPSPQLWPHIAGDGGGGAIVVWRDNRRGFKVDEWDIYAQRVVEVVRHFYLPLVLKSH